MSKLPNSSKKRAIKSKSKISKKAPKEEPPKPKPKPKYPGVAPGFEHLYEMGLFNPGAHISAMQAQGYAFTRPGYVR